MSTRDLWTIVAWLLIATAAVDGSGYTILGPAVASTTTYSALVVLPGGVRLLGVAALAVAVGMGWALGADREGHGRRALIIACGAGMIYYAAWLLAILIAALQAGRLVALGAPTKAALIAGLYFALAVTVDTRRGAHPERACG